MSKEGIGYSKLPAYPKEANISSVREASDVPAGDGLLRSDSAQILDKNSAQVPDVDILCTGAVIPTLATSPSFSSLDPNPDLPLLGTADTPKQEVIALIKRFRGVIAILIATALSSINPQILYYIHEVRKLDYPSHMYLMWSSTIYTILNGVPLIFEMYRDSDSVVKPFEKSLKTKLFLLACRGLCGSLILYFTWHAITKLGTPAPVSVINAMAPIFVYINAFFVLHERLGVFPILNAFLALGGVVVMNLSKLQDLNSQSGNDAWIGTLMALISMYLLSWATVLVRLLRALHPIVLNISFGFIGTFVMGTVSGITGSAGFFRELSTVGLCLCTASIATLNNLFFNYALKHEQAGVVSLIRTSEVIFNFTFQYIFFDLKPEIWTIVGGLMVIFGVVCVTLRKIVIESAEHSKLRKYLFFLKY